MLGCIAVLNAGFSQHQLRAVFRTHNGWRARNCYSRKTDQKSCSNLNPLPELTSGTTSGTGQVQRGGAGALSQLDRYFARSYE
jgi:hypothetical protein